MAESFSNVTANLDELLSDLRGRLQDSVSRREQLLSNAEKEAAFAAELQERIHETEKAVALLRGAFDPADPA